MDRDKFLSDFDLNNKEGLVFGELRLADLDIEIINDIIRQENDKIDFLGSRISPENAQLYSRLINRLYPYDEFIKSPYPIHEHNYKRYRKDLEGFFEYMQDTKPQLANFFLDYFQPYFADSVRHCHTYITGKSGLGKSEIMKTIIINHILRKNCAVVLIEPHGDLSRQIYKSKVFLDQEQAERLITIDYNLDNHFTPVINIFDQINCKDEQGNFIENDIDRVSQEYAKALSSICTSSTSGELSYKMEMILRFCVRVILRKKDGCLEDLKRFMSTHNDDLIALGRQDPNRATRDFFESNDFNKVYKETKEAVYNRLQNLLQDTAFQNLTTGESTIKLKASINTRKVIIINLSKGGIGSYASASFGKLIIAVIKIIGLQRDKVQVEWQRVQAQVFIDEFQNYISDAIKETLEELRKYKIFLTLANQYVGQDLSVDEMRSIFANTGMKIVAQTSPDNSTKIAKELSIESEKINNLAQGEYYLMYANNKKIPITIKIKGSTKYLGDSFAMDNTAWNGLKNAQIGKYYVKVGKYTYKPPQAPQSENQNDYKQGFENPKHRRTEQTPNFDDLSF